MQPRASFSQTLPVWHGLIEQYACVMSGPTGTKFWAQTKQTYLHPVGEPVAFRVCALHCEQNIASRNDTPLRHCLDLNRQVSIVFL